MFANKYSSYKFRKRGVRGMKTQRIYRELTARGKVVCGHPLAENIVRFSKWEIL